MITAFLYLMAAHFLCDFPLQGEFLASAKNPRSRVKLPLPWWHCLLTHSFIQGAGVAVVTQSWVLGGAEIVAHFVVDLLKCRGHLTAAQDQYIHWVGRAALAALSCLVVD